MEIGFIREVLYVLLAGLTGGILAKYVRLQPIIGYIVAGICFGFILPSQTSSVTRIAQIGAVLLLFSIGLELSFERLKRIVKVAIIGGILQVIVTSFLLYFFLRGFGFDFTTALILALGFSLSSTAVVVKILSDRGEIETLHGELMLGWLLVQDLAVIPVMVVMPTLVLQGTGFIVSVLFALLKALGAIFAVVALGKLIVPYLMQKVVALNSRELLLLASVALALGTAMLTSSLGVTAALGAFLAGVVISETQENHAVFAETRPLRDLFVAIFFITLGFLVKPTVLFDHFYLILALTLLVFSVKFAVLLLINNLFSYRGRTAFLSSLGLTQIGEFSFILIVQAVSLKLVSEETASIAIATALASLLLTPLIFKYSLTIYRWIKGFSQKWSLLNRFFTGREAGILKDKMDIKDHVIICGYGRVGKWVAKALDLVEIDYVVIDYNQSTLKKAKMSGITTIYGDASEKDVILRAGLEEAKTVVVAIPDRVAQEELITMVQTTVPKIKVFSRAHFDEDVERLKFLRVDGVVQPEFEAAAALTKSILISAGRSREEIKLKIKRLRQSRAMTR